MTLLDDVKLLCEKFEAISLGHISSSHCFEEKDVEAHEIFHKEHGSVGWVIEERGKSSVLFRMRPKNELQRKISGCEHESYDNVECAISAIAVATYSIYDPSIMLKHTVPLLTSSILIEAKNVRFVSLDKPLNDPNAQMHAAGTFTFRQYMTKSSDYQDLIYNGIIDLTSGHIVTSYGGVVKTANAKYALKALLRSIKEHVYQEEKEKNNE